MFPPLFQHIDNEITGCVRPTEFNRELSSVLIHDATGNALVLGSHVVVAGLDVAPGFAPAGIIPKAHGRLTVEAQSHRVLRHCLGEGLQPERNGDAWAGMKNCSSWAAVDCIDLYAHLNRSVESWPEISLRLIESSQLLKEYPKRQVAFGDSSRMNGFKPKAFVDSNVLLVVSSQQAA